MTERGEGTGRPRSTPARLVWVNGAHGVGKTTLAGLLRDHWGAVVFDAEAIGFTLQAGLGPLHHVDDLADLAVWRTSVIGIGTELARTYQPLVVMPATVYRPAGALDIIEGLDRTGIDVVHVVLSADEATLIARIHARPLDRRAKRWALEHLRPALTGLAEIQGTVRIDTTQQEPGALAHVLAGELMRRGWLTENGDWTPSPAH